MKNMIKYLRKMKSLNLGMTNIQFENVVMNYRLQATEIKTIPTITREVIKHSKFLFEKT